MESRILNLKNDFNNIINTRNSVKNILDSLLMKINKLKLFYLEFIKNNKDELFVFGLDTFHFQSRLIDIEYDGIMRLFLAINNRMYCEYFKLHKIMTDYILKNINDKKYIEMIKANKFPLYKDLEPFKEYEFELVLEMHDNILNLFNILVSLLNNKENEIIIHKSKQEIGLNINNFVNTFMFQNVILREKITLFITYIEFFHKMHTKYFKRFSNKIQLMHTNITNDIRFDESVQMNNEKKQAFFEDLNIDEMDKDLFNSLKKTINSEESSEASDIEENKSIINVNDNNNVNDNDNVNKTKSRSNSVTSELSVISLSTTTSNNNTTTNNSNDNISFVIKEEKEEEKEEKEETISNLDTENPKKKRTYKPRNKKN
jgi:hypothetical protein